MVDFLELANLGKEIAAKPHIMAISANKFRFIVAPTWFHCFSIAGNPASSLASPTQGSWPPVSSSRCRR